MQEIIKPEIVQQHGNGKPRPLTILLVVQVLQHTVTHLTHHITNLHNLTHSHQPAINTVNPLYTFKHQPSTLMLHIFNQTCTNPLPHRLHKITKTLTIIQTNNKCTHRQHNHFNTQLPQSFNPQVLRLYFPQYPSTNSPSANSTDSSILLALQKQWERQERLDMERNKMERQKEERERMKEEREQRKEDRK